jgi:peptidoglycan/LPS O-acetylase OafA/YrhL
MSFVTIQEKMDRAVGQTTGFDYLRIGLSLAVLTWHSIWFAGQAQLSDSLWDGKFRFLGSGIVPVFFALSGFLVAGSLLRSSLPQFVTLRVIRLLPALAVEIVVSATVIGIVFTNLPVSQYLIHPEFRAYFLNIFGIVHFKLPGVFEDNPGGPWINAQLWTIPFELECYVALVILSICTLIRRKNLLISLVAAASVGMTIWAITLSPIDPHGNPPGRVMVLCFLAAVSLYLYRDRIPYYNLLGIASVVSFVIFADIPSTAYMMAFPAAYVAVWIGLMRPPKIPFGDLSYGVYLFHLPIEQTIVRLLPMVRAWWVLTLISVPLVVAVAWLSWTFVESPILSRKKSIVTAVDRAWKAMLSKVEVSLSN